jgi:CSLREA domain-containing protein
MHTKGSIQERIIINKSLRTSLSAFILLAILFGGMPVQRVQAANTWTVTKAADTDDGLCDRDCSLREAIYAAQTGDTIVFSRNQTITLLLQLPSIYKKITIKGKGAANTIIQASNCNPVTLAGGCTPASYRVFEVESSGNLTLEGVTVQHGNCDGWCLTAEVHGGGIYNGGTLSVKNSSVQYNSSDWAGGGIYNEENGKLTVTNSTLTANRADFGGGGIHSSSSLTVNNSTLSANISASYGGGIVNWEGGRLTVSNSTFLANSADYDGGGIYSVGATLKLTGSTFFGNTAHHFGGGIYNAGLEITMKNCTLSGNSAYHGGGIYNVSKLTVTDSTFFGNRASKMEGFGGGIHNDDGTLTVTGSLISGNSAYGGGGIHNFGTLEATESTFSANSATVYGGGIYNGNTLYVTDSTFSTNSATSYGGGIYNGSTLFMTDSTFFGNMAPNGAGISNDGEQYLTNTFPDN